MADERKFNPVTPAVKDDIRPEFLGGHGGGTGSGGGAGVAGGGLNSTKEGTRLGAAKDLNSAEKAATNSELNNNADGLYNARKNENEAGGFYSGKNSVKTASSKMVKGKFKGRFKKGGPIIAIFMVIFGFGGLMAGTQVFQPFSLVAQLQETFNSMHKSTHMRSSRFLRYQLNGGNTKDPVRGTIFGKKFKITDKQKDELQKQGIELNDERTVMTYENAKGEKVEVTADNFDSKYGSDAEFFHKYNAGSMTWRGQFANWFGTNTANFIKNNKLTRNLFKDFKEKKGNGTTEDGLKIVKQSIEQRAKGGGDIEIRESVKEDETRQVPMYERDEEGNLILDDEGNPKPVYDDEGNPRMEEEVVESKLNPESEKMTGDVQAKVDKIIAKFNGAANIGCAVVGAIGAISLMVAAQEALQIMSIVMPYMEAVNKTQAGYGDESPINEIATTLNESVESEYELVNESGDGSESATLKGTAMESAGVAALYDGGQVNPKDPSVQSFNLQSSMNRIIGGIGASANSFKDCAIAKAGAAFASMVVDGLSIAGCIAGLLGAAFTFGISATACGPMIVNFSLQAGLSAVVGAALGALAEFIVPVVSNMMTRDLVGTLAGHDLGNALTSGGNMYQGGVHRFSGGSLATEDKYTEFAAAQRQVIADDARYERENLSPFDITSKNTFMGSIMTQLMSFNTSNSLMGTITSAGSVMSSSLMGLNFSVASAYDIAESLPDMDEYEETCPYLASIGAVGDSYCNPYIITDTGTIDDNPVDVIDKIDNDFGGFNGESSDGNVVIDKSSRLAKYIVYCDNRASQFGTADYGIANEIGNFGTVSTGNSLVDNAGNGLIGGVPVLGDVFEIVNDATQLSNIGYISGQSCVAGGENIDGAADSPEWENEAKYYQRFIEDQSLAESMGVIEKSAITAFLEEYYEENPLDNSYEGMLARYSGLDKETVADVLDIVAYYRYINDYNPSERYAFDGAEEEKADTPVDLGEEYVMDGWGVALEDIVYTDVRNRSFAV